MADWKALSSRLQDVIRKIAVQVLFTEEVKEKVLTRLNQLVNLPILDEQTERELFESIWDAIREALVDILGAEDPTKSETKLSSKK